MDQPKVEICNGTMALLLNLLAYLFGHLYPTLTTIGAVCGSFLAIHGAYVVIRNYLKGRPNSIHIIPIENNGDKTNGLN